MNANRAGFFFLLLLAAPMLLRAQDTPVIGQAYDLELSDGTRLKNAIYRGKKDTSDSFEVKSVVGLLQLRDYRVLPPHRPLGFMLTAAMQYQAVYDQKHLGFNEAIAGVASLSLPVFSVAPAYIPRLFTSAGFTRFSGSKALLSGPEATAGLNWLVQLAHAHFLFINLSAGAGFYRLLNQSLAETFTQNTFIAVGEAGYALRFARWGLTLSYIQQYVHDLKLPLNAGGIRFGAVYFGGNA